MNGKKHNKKRVNRGDGALGAQHTAQDKLRPRLLARINKLSKPHETKTLKANNSSSAETRQRIENRAKRNQAKKSTKQAELIQKSKLRAERERAVLEKRRKSAEKRRSRYVVVRAKLRNNPRGFDSGNYGFLPRVEFVVTAADSAGMLCMLSAGGVSVCGIQRNDNKTYIKVAKKDAVKAIAIFDKMCYNYSVGQSYGIGRTLAFLPARIGLLIGVVSAVLASSAMTLRVWRIDIDGNDAIPTPTIMRALHQAGFSPGVKKSEFDVQTLVSALTLVQGVADASVEVVGTTARVHVLESSENEIHNKFTSFVSAYDATVTRVAVRSGTALVKRGDVVAKGDVLCDGAVYSSTNELMYVGECDADVYGNVAITFSANVSEYGIEYVRTGRVKTKKSWQLFGYNVFNHSSPFASYETVVTKANYDVLIPLIVSTYNYYETEPTQVERDIDKLAKEFMSQKTEEMSFIGDFKADYTVKPTDYGMHEVHVFLSGEALISRGSDYKPSIEKTEN